MLTTQRVLHGTTDISAKVNDFRSGAYVFAYTSGQYLYVGSEMPFNHLWFQLTSGTLNAVAASVSVDLWWNLTWTPAVDVIDETVDAATGTKPLAVSGRVTWACDIEKGWQRELKSADVTGLSGTNIYNLYWARLSWSQTLTGTLSLDHVGQKFAGDTELYSFYPALNNSGLKTRFAAGKTTWDEQHFAAAEAIARELIGRRLIFSRSQIFDWSRLQVPAVHKAAQLIFAGCGAPMAADYAQASKAYEAAMNQDCFRVSHGEHLTDRDKRDSVTWGSR